MNTALPISPHLPGRPLCAKWAIALALLMFMGDPPGFSQSDTVRVKLFHPAMQSNRFHLGLSAVWPAILMPDEAGKTRVIGDLKFLPSFCFLPFNKLVAGVFLYPSSYETFRTTLVFPDSSVTISGSGEGETRLFLPGLFFRYYLLNSPRNIFLETAVSYYPKSRTLADPEGKYKPYVFERQTRIGIGMGYSWFSDGLAFEAGFSFSRLQKKSLAWSDLRFLHKTREAISWALEPKIGLVYYF